MIHQDTNIQFIDTSSKEEGTISISDLFQRYTHFAEFEKYSTTIRFRNPVKIKDGVGWTDLLSVCKIYNAFIDISIESGDHTLQCNSYTKLPISRDIMSDKISSNELVRASNIKIGDIVSLANSQSISRITNVIKDHIITSHGNDGYILSTRSKYFNANGFKLYSDEGSV